eukprot:3411104-Prymnesium_polylepis.1
MRQAAVARRSKRKQEERARRPAGESGRPTPARVSAATLRIARHVGALWGTSWGRQRAGAQS